MRRIAIVNQKGGCGKTTTAINLAGVFARTGRRTLLVDTDPQSHCAAGLAIPEGRIDLHIGDAMLAAGERPVDPARLLWRVSRNLDLAPSSVRLATLESARGGLSSKPQPERCLAEALKPFDAEYDLCLIDCSPAIGLLTFNALSAADQIIIPVETGFFSLQGASRQVSTIKSLAKRVGGGGGSATTSPNYRLLPTMHDPESALACDLLEELRRRFPGRVAPMVIRFDQRLRESASFGQPVIEYAPDSAGAADYLALAAWLLELPEENRREGAPDEAVVNVVPGIGQRLPVPAAGASPIAPAPTVGRAADIAARARRLQDAANASAGAETVASPSVMGAADEPAPEPIEDQQREEEDQGRPKVYGARGTNAGVSFLQPLSLGRRICVAGDFNGWSADATPMLRSEALGAFELHLPAGPGLLQYRLIVDGRWMTDPYNPLMAPNTVGGANSVVVVPGAPVARPVASATG